MCLDIFHRQIASNWRTFHNFALTNETTNCIMATENTKKSKKRKLTEEERRAVNMARPVGNKYMEAFRKYKGTINIYDPAFML